MTTNDYASHVARWMARLEGDERLAGLELVIEQRIVDSGGGEETWHVRFSGGSVDVAAGPASDAHVVITQDRRTADALRQGDTNAHRAFLTGRLRVDGDVDLLVEHTDLLQDLVGEPRA